MGLNLSPMLEDALYGVDLFNTGNTYFIFALPFHFSSASLSLCTIGTTRTCSVFVTSKTPQSLRSVSRRRYALPKSPLNAQIYGGLIANPTNVQSDMIPSL